MEKMNVYIDGCYGEHNKGRKFTDEYKAFISKRTKEAMKNLSLEKKMKMKETSVKNGKSGLGRKASFEAKVNMSLAHKGVKFSEEHKIKIGKGNEGKIVSNEVKQRIKDSNARTWGAISEVKLKEHKEKISKGVKKWWDNLSEGDRRKQIDSMLNASNKKFIETKIELKVREQLDKCKINYKCQYYQYDKINKKRYYFDFYLPDYKLVVEANGDYWHNLPDMIIRDKLKEEFILRTNHKILWLWEHEINKKDFDVNLCIDKIKKETNKCHI